MKKVFLFCFCIFISVSCNQPKSGSVKSKSLEKSEFRGFGELIIGCEFSSLLSYHQFKSSCENLFYADNYEVSKDIGIVENVTILLKNGKIHDVGFSNSSIYNKNKLDSCFRSYKSKVLNLPSSGKDWRVYNSTDDKVRISITIMKNDYLYHYYGYYPTSYFYYDLTDEDTTDYGI